ncbi:NAD(P)H-hydrate dehydratase [Vibrio sp. T187]|uniref:NAD(P)H-hydrate dehydratase n=1 Tax=Vibrio TaxID=662 RepID=UPI0010C955A8|nr:MULTISPECIES: NAD(P)H-hydrate dehydratase [Vibrio]MBW3695709.1 NAD(P)H-hydrate dehydratase [Vibrio sp. T187]
MEQTRIKLYTAEQVRRGEILAAKRASVPMFELMERAGAAIFNVLKQQYPKCKHVLVCCGNGNNGGDGFVVARLAKLSGLRVSVWHLGAVDKLKGDAKRAYEQWLEVGGEIQSDHTLEQTVDLVVDALLGTGLNGKVRPNYRVVIEGIKQSGLPVLSIDVPSGLNSDTGVALGCCIKASYTVTFIGRKLGLYTGQARGYTGEIVFDGLGVKNNFEHLASTSSFLVSFESIKSLIPTRNRTAHKGSNGKLLCVGGSEGMGGAILLTTEAALKLGCGLVCTATSQANLNPLLVRTPEAMSCNWIDLEQFEGRMIWSTALAIGPGLSTNKYSQELYQLVATSRLPKVVDADALNILAEIPTIDDQRVLTPHPGEAARLLGVSVSEIEEDRISSVKHLQKRYGGVVVLKGAGTIIYNGDELYICAEGNPGMATGGMGDVLTGVIGSFLAQGLSVEDASLLGVMAHSCAADVCVKSIGEQGLLASEVINSIRALINRV